MSNVGEFVIILVFVKSLYLAGGELVLTDKIDRDDFNHQSGQSSGRDDINHGYLLSFSDIELLFDSQNSVLQELLTGQTFLRKQNENFIKKYRSLRRYLRRINRACACRSQQIKKAIHTAPEQSERRKDSRQENVGNLAISKRRKERARETDSGSFSSSIVHEEAVNKQEIKSKDSGKIYNLSEKPTQTNDDGYDKQDQSGTREDIKSQFHNDISASFGNINGKKKLRGNRKLHISTPGTTDIHRQNLHRKKEPQESYESSVNHDYQQSQQSTQDRVEIEILSEKHSGFSSIDKDSAYNDDVYTTGLPKHEGVPDHTESAIGNSDSIFATTKQIGTKEPSSTADIYLMKGARSHTHTTVPNLVPKSLSEAVSTTEDRSLSHTHTTVPNLVPKSLSEAVSTTEDRSLSLTPSEMSSQIDPIEKYDSIAVKNNLVRKSLQSSSTSDPKDNMQMVTNLFGMVETNSETNVNGKLSSISDAALRKDLGHDMTEKSFNLKSTGLHDVNLLDTKSKDEISPQQIDEPNVQTHLIDDMSTIKPSERIIDDKTGIDRFRSYVDSSHNDRDGDNTNSRVRTENTYSSILKAKQYNFDEQILKRHKFVKEDDNVNSVDISYDKNNVDGEQYESRKRINKHNVYKNVHFNEILSKDISRAENKPFGGGTLEQNKQNGVVSEHDRDDKTTHPILKNSVAPGVSNFEVATESMVTDDVPKFIQTFTDNDLYDELETEERKSAEKSEKLGNTRQGSIADNHIDIEDRSNFNHLTSAGNAIDTNDELVTSPNVKTKNKRTSKTYSNTLNEIERDISEVQGSINNNGFNLFDELQKGKHSVKWNYFNRENSLEQEITPTSESKQTKRVDKQAPIDAFTSSPTSYDTLNKEAGGRGQSSGMNSNVKEGFYDLEVDLSTGKYRGNHFAITWVSNLTRGVSNRCGVQGVVQLSFPYTLPDEVQETIMIDMWFDTPTSWIFNIGDSRTNDGFSGDAGTQENDCEAEGHGTTFAVHGSDKSHDPLNKLLKIEEDFLNKTASFLVTNEQISWRGQDESNYNQLRDKNLFALKGQSDKQGAINYDVFVSMNRVIAGNYRKGHGLCWIGFKWLTATK